MGSLLPDCVRRPISGSGSGLSATLMQPVGTGGAPCMAAMWLCHMERVEQPNATRMRPGMPAATGFSGPVLTPFVCKAAQWHPTLGTQAGCGDSKCTQATPKGSGTGVRDLPRQRPLGTPGGAWGNQGWRGSEESIPATRRTPAAGTPVPWREKGRAGTGKMASDLPADCVTGNSPRHSLSLQTQIK